MEITKGLCVSLVFGLVLFLFSCGGGDSISNEAGTPSVTSGVVVDPYIAGARFQEVLDDGTLGQISTPSDDKGKFSFGAPLSQGSVVVTLDKGIHNGSPYLGSLKAREHHIDAQGRLIISPLTTLLSNYEELGYTPARAEANVVNLFVSAGLNLLSEDLVKDPMESAKQEGKLNALQANMSANAFLQALQQAGHQGFDVDDSQNYESVLLSFQQLLKDLVTMVLANLSSTDLSPLKSEIEAMLGDTIPDGYELDLNDLILSLLTSCDYAAEQIANDLLEDGTVDVPVENWVSDKSLKKLILLNFVSRLIVDIDFEAFYTNCKNKNKDLPDVISGETFPPGNIPRYWQTTSFPSVLKPMVRMDDKGNAIAIWEQRNPSEWSIFVSHYSVGLGWESPELIEGEVGGGLNPYIAIDDDGNALAIWEQADGEKMSIMANYYTFGVGWGIPEYIESDNVGNAHDPKIDFDGAGNAIAVWHQLDPVYSIYANRFVKGVGWGAAESLESETTWGATDAEVVMDNAGNAIAVWTQGDGAQNNVMCSRYTVDSGWSTEGFIETNPEQAYGPQVAVDAVGNVMVVWYQNESGIQNVWANRFDISTGWGGAERIESGSRRATGVRVGMDADGNATAVWYQYVDSRSDIMSNRYVVGVGWGTEEVIESENLGYAYHPQVAVNSKGNAIAVWEQSDGTRFNVWANFFDAKNGWGAAKILDSDPSGDATDAFVAISRLGTAVAVWLQTGGVAANEYK